MSHLEKSVPQSWDVGFLWGEVISPVPRGQPLHFVQFVGRPLRELQPRLLFEPFGDERVITARILVSEVVRDTVHRVGDLRQHRRAVFPTWFQNLQQRTTPLNPT